MTPPAQMINSTINIDNSLKLDSSRMVFRPRFDLKISISECLNHEYVTKKVMDPRVKSKEFGSRLSILFFAHYVF